MKKKTVYYSDELHDDFAGVGERRKVEVGEDFPYVRKNIFYNIAAFIVYRIFVTPFAFLFCKIKFGMKIVGKEKIKPYKKADFTFMATTHRYPPTDLYRTS